MISWRGGIPPDSLETCALGARETCLDSLKSGYGPVTVVVGIRRTSSMDMRAVEVRWVQRWCGPLRIIRLGQVRLLVHPSFKAH